MPRPRCPRRVAGLPKAALFKPRGVPLRDLQEVVLAVEELEALRLADRDGLYQADAAGRMGVSRATFGRVLTEARRKVAEALCTGKALRIEGGDFEQAPGRGFDSAGPPQRRRRRRRGTGPSRTERSDEEQET